jgi:hypothetical protein
MCSMVLGIESHTLNFSPRRRWYTRTKLSVNHFENGSGDVRAFMAIRSSSSLGSQAAWSWPRIGKYPIDGLSSQLLRKSRST